MTRLDMEEDAFETICSGRNCAESVLAAALKGLGIGEQAAATRIATAFGGGVGRSKDELCGALAGGVMALGLLFGRDAPGEPCEQAFALTAELRNRFIRKFGSSTCRAILERFGEQDSWEQCKRLTASAAGLLFDVVAEAEQTRGKGQAA